MCISDGHALTNRSELRSENSISCGSSLIASVIDFCLKPGKIEALKMLDLQTKSAIKSI
jgi:hypothetical protein